jgi:hypothetical protein
VAGTRTINVRWMRAGTSRPLDLDAKPDVSITYDGTPQTIRMR